MWTHSSIHDYTSIVPSASAKLVNLMKGRHRLCRQDKSIMKKAILLYSAFSIATRSARPDCMNRDLDHHWKMALAGVFLLEYMNEDFLRTSACYYPGPTWPSLFCPLTTWNHVSIVAEWLSTFVQLIPSQLLRRPSQIQLVYVFHSTRSDVPTIGGGDHVDLSRVNFAYSGMSMGALAH